MPALESYSYVRIAEPMTLNSTDAVLAAVGFAISLRLTSSMVSDAVVFEQTKVYVKTSITVGMKDWVAYVYLWLRGESI